jgi:hypothetical protein
LTKTEIIDTLKRSGYLFESSIIEFLNKNDYFVESSAVIIDPVTGKNRDIDIIAKRNDLKKDYDNKISTQVTFAFELKNNLYPVVLMSKYQFNPNSPSDLIKEIVTAKKVKNYHGFENYYEKLIYDSRNIFSQYCSFNKKNRNSELMAYHPDELYSGISKVIQYCEETSRQWNERFNDLEEDFERNDDWFRHWVYLPVILLKNDLYEMEINKEEPILKKVEKSQMILNYHHKNEKCSALVTFVTEKGLEKWLSEIRELELQAEKDILEKIKNFAQQRL